MTDAPEYLSPTILDSRRLFGPNLFSARAGAVLEVACDTDDRRHAVDVWTSQAQRLMAGLGWIDDHCLVQRSTRLSNLYLSAPLDGLLTATDLSEHAWVAAEAQVSGSEVADATPVLRESYARERMALPQVVAIAAYARAHRLTFSLDDEACSVGSGAGVRAISHAEAAHDASADSESAWEGASDVPIALVTGSNGKTTTTRLVAAMWRAAGRAAGWCCSDGVWVDGTQVESGDYTGPAAARRVLCDPRVGAAVLETARGGMLRRGLALDRADGAVITNISADHFGEYGIETLDDLAQAKAIVTRALRPGAAVVLNADDPSLVRLAAGLEVPVAWFSATDHPVRHASVMDSAPTHDARVRDGHLHLCRDGAWHDLGPVRGMPITLDGRAQHNVANATAAALLASVVGVPLDGIRRALETFGAVPTDNPGRLMVREVGGVTLVMDYAHNPDGMTWLCRTAASLPAHRRLLLLGQAGNRDDAQVRALAAAAWSTQPFDRVILKEMSAMLRGRSAGEVPALLRAGLLGAGAPSHAVADAPSELDGVRAALDWARPGDLLVLGVHVERRRVLALVDQLVAAGWTAGAPLPTSTTSP